MLKEFQAQADMHLLIKCHTLKMLLKQRIFRRCILLKCSITINIWSRNQCPVNDKLCEEAVWFAQNMLLAEKSDMDDIATAIQKVHKNADKIKRPKII